MEELPAIIMSVFGGGAMLALAVGIADRLRTRKPPKASPGLRDPHADAIALLEARYATGEIDRDEFLERQGYLRLSAERRQELEGPRKQG